MLSDLFPIHPTSPAATDRPAPFPTVQALEAFRRLPCGARTRARHESRESERFECRGTIQAPECDRTDSDVFGFSRGSLSPRELNAITRYMSDFSSQRMSYFSSYFSNSFYELLRGLLSGSVNGLEVPFRFSLAFSSSFASRASHEVRFARGESGRRFVVKPLSRRFGARFRRRASRASRASCAPSVARFAHWPRS